MTESILDVFRLAALAACSVGLWTLRVAVAAAGRRLAAAAIAALEAVLFAVAFSAVITALNDPLRIGGYALGVSLGTLIGIAADERLSTGQSLVRIVVDGDGRAETDALRARGWPMTRSGSDGVRGGVAVLTVAVDDTVLPRLRADIDGTVHGGFETVERLRSVRPTPLPTGLHTTSARSTHRAPASPSDDPTRAPQITDTDTDRSMSMTVHPTTARPDTHDEHAFDNGRGRFNVWFFTIFDRYINLITRRHKRHAFTGITGPDVVELGPGVGANFRFMPRGSRVLAAEPNRAMHGALLDRAAAHGVDLELLECVAEDLPLPDRSVDDVVCSLVLCTVDDPDRVLAEAHRVLRPGGSLRFVEHVTAHPLSPRHWLQRAIRRPWAWVFEGCRLDRDTGDLVERAGFRQVDIRRHRFRQSVFIPVNTAVSGVATKRVRPYPTRETER